MFMDVDALIYTCQLESSYLKGYYKKSKKALCLSQGIMRISKESLVYLAQNRTL